MVCRFAHVIQSQKKCQVWRVCCAQTSAATAMTLLTASERGLQMINTIQLHGAPMILLAILSSQATCNNVEGL
jgi:hypothetical protein